MAHIWDKGFTGLKYEKRGGGGGGGGWRAYESFLDHMAKTDH